MAQDNYSLDASKATLTKSAATATPKTKSVWVPILVFLLGVGVLTIFGFFGQEIQCEIGHQYSDWREVQAPGCETAGENRRYCEICNHYEVQKIEGLDHEYTSTLTDPTCTEQGYTMYTCRLCGDSYVDSYVNALGHTEAVTVAVSPDCTNTGLTAGKHCSVCNDVLVSQESVNALGHDEIVHNGKQPTVTETGWTEYITCTRCDYCAGYTELPATGSIGLTYKLNSDGQSYSVSDVGNCTDSEIFIASIYQGMPVTSIDSSAFESCDRLTSITIPDGVTSIGLSTFRGCTSLTSVTIPDSVTSIGHGAFYGCSSLTSVTIPDSVTSIGNAAFSGCTRLTSITIPFVGAKKDGTSNTNFGYIFGAISYSNNRSCVPKSLKTVIITGGSSIEKYAFSGCTSLTSITIPTSVTSIGSGAFRGCTSLTSITIPDGVTSIGDYAFYNCALLTSITIPDSVTSIGDSAFAYCTSLTDVYYTGTEDEWAEITIYATGNMYLIDATIHYK